jgi:paraquat-inducible protein B
MSKPANKRLIGVFVLGAIALLVIAVVVLGSGKFFRKIYVAVCYFEGSVGGLNIGAPVVFRGVKVGSVKDVILRYDPQNLTIQIPVYIELDPSKSEIIGPRPKEFEEDLRSMIDRGLRAQLEMQSIVTGQMYVGLDFHPEKPAKLVGADAKYPEIPTIPTPLQEIAKKIEQLPLDEIIKNITTAVEGINRLVNSPEI